MPRVASLFVPLFPLAARLRSEPELVGETVAVCEGNGSAARVVAASRVARQAGLRPGMTLAQARSVLPDLVARGRDPMCERSAHEALLEVALNLSPRVEDAAEDLIFADVSGMECLFENEEQLGHEAMTSADSLGLLIRIAVASTKLAARVATHAARSPVVVPNGREADFLAPLPLHHLHLARRLAETLNRWGVTRIGELARLPADRVASRLGTAGSAAHQTARGVDPHPLVPHHPPLTMSEGMELEWPVVTVDPLLAALRQSLERIEERLASQDLACTLVELELGLEPEGADRRAVRLPSPTRDIDAIIGLVRLELEARPPRAPVAAFACVIHPDEPRRGQLTLFGPPEIHPDRLATSLAGLAARLGPERVGSPRTVDGHLPERSDSAPFDPPPAPRLRQSPRQGRGLLVVRVLRPPVELEVIVEDPRLQVKGSRLKVQEFPHPTGNTKVAEPQPSWPKPNSPPQTENRPEGQGRTEGKLQRSTFDVRRSTPGVGGGNLSTHRRERPVALGQGVEEGGGGHRATRSSRGVAAPEGREQPSTFNLQLSAPPRLLSISSVVGAKPRIQGLVRVTAGPWRLEHGWWSDRPVERDYWDVELSDGGLYRIYQDSAGEWFADGIYD